MHHDANSNIWREIDKVYRRCGGKVSWTLTEVSFYLWVFNYLSACAYVLCSKIVGESSTSVIARDSSDGINSIENFRRELPM